MHGTLKPEVVATLRFMQELSQSGFENVQLLTNFLEFFWKWFTF
jgi:hypothetical protein